MRDIETLIKALKCLIPLHEELLIRELDSIVSSSQFAPPELRGLHFERLTEAFSEQCNPPETPWQLQCCAILNDEHIDKVRADVARYKESIDT